MGEKKNILGMMVGGNGKQLVFVMPSEFLCIWNVKENVMYFSKLCLSLHV